jgi:hypothetical protein
MGEDEKIFGNSLDFPFFVFTDQDDDPNRRNHRGRSQRNLIGRGTKAEIAIGRRRVETNRNRAVEAGREGTIVTEGRSEFELFLIV